MGTVLPFAAGEGTWQCGVELRPGLVRAVSNVHACLVEVDGLEVDGPTALTSDAAKWLSDLTVEPNGWLRGDGWLAFRWPSGAIARCQLMAHAWPAMVDGIFNGATAETPIAVTDGWRENFAHMKALGEGTVDLDPGGMVGRSPHAEHRAEFATGVERETRWTIKAMGNVLAIAAAWGPDTSTGEAAPFRGSRLRGVVMGRRR
jgi:hypothetical protein